MVRPPVSNELADERIDSVHSPFTVQCTHLYAVECSAKTDERFIVAVLACNLVYKMAILVLNLLLLLLLLLLRQGQGNTTLCTVLYCFPEGLIFFFFSFSLVFKMPRWVFFFFFFWFFLLYQLGAA